ncbi:TPA: hypothetical protein N0F65_011642 [Lagenidium giganteum]|uniref:Glutamine cyclotransferase n=1 Tax=Lagenidium giganteum TaxID=4803 RepID=A0AAV2Z7B4_9STRA|nr:TPA: hypothetical protein N0F65_011642 [Lagenidium giganteum]
MVMTGGMAVRSLVLGMAVLGATLLAAAAEHRVAAVHAHARALESSSLSSDDTRVRVVSILPHNSTAFTEGLFFHNGKLLESTGLSGSSFVREYNLPSMGRSINVVAREDVENPILQEFRFPSGTFGEGIATVGDKLYALTYKAKKIYVLSRKNLELLESHPFVTSTGEGWGMTTDNKSLIVSDGSAKIQFYDPVANFTLIRTIEVRDGNRAISNVNELEFVDGEILANVWFKNEVLRIDPKDGRVIETIDFSWLPDMVTNLKNMKSMRHEAVMNGIAFNPANRHVYLTGKLWDSLFEIEFSCYKTAAASSDVDASRGNS